MSKLSKHKTENTAITDTLQHYIDGARRGSGEVMKPAFHANATIFGHAGDDLLAGPIQGLFDWADSNGPSPELQAEIESIDIVDSVAVVRLKLVNLIGFQYTDILSLLRIDGEWKIVNKVFHFHG